MFLSGRGFLVHSIHRALQKFRKRKRLHAIFQPLDYVISKVRDKQILGTLRYETRRLLDAAGSKFSQTREVAHVQSIVLLVSRCVEDVGWRGLAFCIYLFVIRDSHFEHLFTCP